MSENSISQAETAKEEGIKLFNQHDYEAANRSFQTAKDAYEAAGDYAMVAEMKVNIGLVHRALGESQQALELMQEALRQFQEKNDKLRLAHVQGNLGGVYLALDDKEKAEHSYREAMEIFKELGEDQLHSDTMMALGRMLFTSGQIMKGAYLYEVALRKRQNLSFSQRIILFLSNLINRISGANPV